MGNLLSDYTLSKTNFDKKSSHSLSQNKQQLYISKSDAGIINKSFNEPFNKYKTRNIRSEYKNFENKPCIRMANLSKSCTFSEACQKLKRDFPTRHNSVWYSFRQRLIREKKKNVCTQTTNPDLINNNKTNTDLFECSFKQPDNLLLIPSSPLTEVPNSLPTNEISNNECQFEKKNNFLTAATKLDASTDKSCELFQKLFIHNHPYVRPNTLFQSRKTDGIKNNEYLVDADNTVRVNSSILDENDTTHLLSSFTSLEPSIQKSFTEDYDQSPALFSTNKSDSVCVQSTANNTRLRNKRVAVSNARQHYQPRHYSAFFNSSDPHSIERLSTPLEVVDKQDDGNRGPSSQKSTDALPSNVEQTNESSSHQSTDGLGLLNAVVPSQSLNLQLTRNYRRLRSLPGPLMESILHTRTTLTRNKPKRLKERALTLDSDILFTPSKVMDIFYNSPEDEARFLHSSTEPTFMYTQEQHRQFKNSLTSTKSALLKLRRVLIENTGHQHVFRDQISPRSKLHANRNSNCVSTETVMCQSSIMTASYLSTDNEDIGASKCDVSDTGYIMSAPITNRDLIFFGNLPVCGSLDDALVEIEKLKRENEKLKLELLKKDRAISIFQKKLHGVEVSAPP